MTHNEFSNEFDVLIQSYLTKDSFGETSIIAFDEYEKSVFLTNAQEELVVSLYNGRNDLQESFEQTEELRRYLNSLVTTVVLNTTINTTLTLTKKDSYVFELPENILAIIYEQIHFTDDACNDNYGIQVIPVTHDDFSRQSRNPFKGASARKVLRIDAGNNNVELISTKSIKDYIVRYIKKPNPIILDELEDVRINGEHHITECELPEILHKRILDIAILRALNSKGLIKNNN